MRLGDLGFVIRGWSGPLGELVPPPALQRSRGRRAVPACQWLSNGDPDRPPRAPAHRLKWSTTLSSTRGWTTTFCTASSGIATHPARQTPLLATRKHRQPQRLSRILQARLLLFRLGRRRRLLFPLPECRARRPGFSRLLPSWGGERPEQGGARLGWHATSFPGLRG